MSESEDYVAISNLVMRSTHLMDAHDRETYADLFADAELVPRSGRVYQGRDGVLDLYREMSAGAATRPVVTHPGKHVVTDIHIEVAPDGQSATSAANYSFLQDRDGVLRVLVAGRFLDSFAKRSGSWQFTRRQMVRDIGTF